MSEGTDLKEERKNRYYEKLEKVEVRATDIERWMEGVDASEFVKDKKSRLAVYKAYQELVEAITDVCAMYASDSRKGVGDDYENLEKASGTLYREHLEDDLKNANGLRNRIVHEYNKSSDEVAYASINELLPKFKNFRKEVLNWLERR